jgi:secreted trypsin-like serine protease
MCTQAKLTDYGYFRASSKEGSTCNGDSGGPLLDVTTGKLVGVLSATEIVDGAKCVPGARNYYVPTAHVRQSSCRARWDSQATSAT